MPPHTGRLRTSARSPWIRFSALELHHSSRGVSCTSTKSQIGVPSCCRSFISWLRLVCGTTAGSLSPAVEIDANAVSEGPTLAPAPEVTATETEACTLSLRFGRSVLRRSSAMVSALPTSWSLGPPRLIVLRLRPPPLAPPPSSRPDRGDDVAENTAGLSSERSVSPPDDVEPSAVTL